MAKPQTTSTDIVEKKPTALAAAAFIDANDYGMGYEGTDSESYAIPFLTILQKMSPQVDEDDAKHIPGAKAGMIYNSVNNDLIDGKNGIEIIQCAYKRVFILWGGREGDGGFKGEFAPEVVDKLEAEGRIKVIDGRYFVPNEDGSVNEKKNDYYADTRSHYVLYRNPESGEVGQAIISLSSSQIKASKNLMTALQQKRVDTPQGKRQPPTFAMMVRFSTVGMSNDKGTWSGARFDIEGMVTDAELYAQAKEFYRAITAGSVKADYSKAGSPTGEVDNAPKDAEGF